MRRIDGKRARGLAGPDEYEMVSNDKEGKGNDDTLHSALRNNCYILKTNVNKRVKKGDNIILCRFIVCIYILYIVLNYMFLRGFRG